MRILVVFTGGTIGSNISQDYITPDSTSGYRLLHMYEQRSGKTFMEQEIMVDTIQPYFILSETLQCKHWICLIKEIKASLGKQKYDGVIVCHGTDTLQYTGAFLSYVFGNDSIPILLASSNFVLEDERANGLVNFAAAIDFIVHKRGKGVFIPYQSEKDKILIHRGSRVLPCVAYSDEVLSMYHSVYGKLKGDLFGEYTYKANPQFCEKQDEIPPVLESLMEIDTEKESGVLEIYPAPGMSYPKVEHLPENIKCVLLHTYHSGTIDTEHEGLITFSKALVQKGIGLYLVGANLEKDYASTQKFQQLQIQVLPEISPVAAYCKLWLKEVCNWEKTYIYHSLGGDIYTSKSFV